MGILYNNYKEHTTLNATFIGIVVFLPEFLCIIYSSEERLFTITFFLFSVLCERPFHDHDLDHAPSRVSWSCVWARGFFCGRDHDRDRKYQSRRILLRFTHSSLEWIKGDIYLYPRCHRIMLTNIERERVNVFGYFFLHDERNRFLKYIGNILCWKKKNYEYLIC